VVENRADEKQNCSPLNPRMFACQTPIAQCRERSVPSVRTDCLKGLWGGGAWGGLVMDESSGGEPHRNPRPLPQREGGKTDDFEVEGFRFGIRVFHHEHCIFASGSTENRGRGYGVDHRSGHMESRVERVFLVGDTHPTKSRCRLGRRECPCFWALRWWRAKKG